MEQMADIVFGTWCPVISAWIQYILERNIVIMEKYQKFHL